MLHCTTSNSVIFLAGFHTELDLTRSFLFPVSSPTLSAGVPTPDKGSLRSLLISLLCPVIKHKDMSSFVLMFANIVVFSQSCDKTC